MILGISVEEHAPLKQGVGRGLDAGNQRARRESSLLYIAVVVFRVSVQRKRSDVLHREQGYTSKSESTIMHFGSLTARPNLGGIEGVKGLLRYFFRFHDLVSHVRCLSLNIERMRT